MAVRTAASGSGGEWPLPHGLRSRRFFANFSSAPAQNGPRRCLPECRIQEPTSLQRKALNWSGSYFLDVSASQMVAPYTGCTEVSAVKGLLGQLRAAADVAAISFGPKYPLSNQFFGR